MIEQLEVQQAIAVLEQYKESLSPTVLELSLSVLQDKLAHLSAQPDEQRYLLTVLEADLSGFTAMAEHLDPEEVRDTIHAVWQTLDGVIERWGGTIDKHIGDSVVAFFGLPAAAADDAERAVHAALDMQVALLRFNQQMRTTDSRLLRQRSSTLKMRVGLSSGMVLLGRLGGNGENTAVGETLREAALLEKHAPIGGVLISEQLYEQVQHQFDVTAQDAVRLPSAIRAIRAFSVERHRPPAFWLSPPKAAGDAQRIVGRSNELVILQEALDVAVVSQSAQVLTIIGETGLGKTRLLQAFEHWLEMFGNNPIVVKGQAGLGSDKRPFALFRNLVETSFCLRDNPPRPLLEIVINRLIRRFSKSRTLAEEMTNTLIDLLYGDATLPNVREAGLVSIIDWIKMMTAQRPMLMLLEEFHHVDEGSLQILSHLLRELPNEPLVVVCAGQPGSWEKRPFWETAQSFDTAGYTNIPLEPLSPIDSRHLINDLLSDVPQLPLRLSDLIMSSASGNPQTIEKMVHFLINHDVLLHEAQRWLVQLGMLHKLRVPRTLQGLFGAQFGELSPDEQLLLQKAAVFGDTFPLSALPSLDIGTLLPTSKQQAALTSLQRQGHLLPLYSTIGKPTHYRFRQPAMRQVAYSSIRLVERALYHQQAAGALAGSRAPQPLRESADIAHHFELGEQQRVAADWYASAAAYAEAQMMPETAVSTYQKAIATLPETADSYQKQIQLNRSLGRLLRRQGKLTPAAAAYKQMAEEAMLLSDTHAEVEARLRLCLIHAFQHEPQAVVAHAKLAQEAAEMVNLPTLVARATVPLSWGLLWLGRQKEAAQQMQQALTAGAAAQDHVTLALGHGLLALLSQLQSNQHSEQFATKGVQLATQVQNPLVLALLQAQFGQLTLSPSVLETVQFQALMSSSEQYLAYLIWLRQGEAAQQQGDFLTAEQAFESALTLAHRFDDMAAVAGTLRLLGLLYLERGYRARTARAQEVDWQQAQRQLQLGERLAAETKQPRLLAQLLLANGRFLLETERLGEAKRAVLTALDMLAKLSSEPLLVRQLQAEAWWLLGAFVAKLPPNKRPFQLDSQTYDPPQCFRNSLKIFGQLPLNSQRLEKQVYLEWAKWEEQWGNEAEATPLRTAAEKLT